MPEFKFNYTSKTRSRFTDLFKKSPVYKRRAPPPLLNDNQIKEDDESHQIALEAAARVAEMTALFVLEEEENKSGESMVVGK